MRWIVPRLTVIVLFFAVVLAAATVVNRFDLTGWPKYLVIGIACGIAVRLALLFGRRAIPR